jgi:hypothetical protein
MTTFKNAKPPESDVTLSTGAKSIPVCGHMFDWFEHRFRVANVETAYEGEYETRRPSPIARDSRFVATERVTGPTHLEGRQCRSIHSRLPSSMPASPHAAHTGPWSGEGVVAMNISPAVLGVGALSTYIAGAPWWVVAGLMTLATFHTTALSVVSLILNRLSDQEAIAAGAETLTA